MAKKYFKSENKVGRLSDGLSTTKKGKKNHENKAKKADTIQFEDGDIVLVDEDTTCSSIAGKVNMFAFKGSGTLIVNDRRIV